MIERISLDMESTIASFMPLYVDSLDNGSTLYNVEDWDWAPSQGDFMSELKKMWQDPCDIEPMEAGLSHTTKILSERFELDIVTNHVGVEKEMLDWLDEHNVYYNEFISTDMSKTEFNYDLFIDDKPGLVEELKPGQEMFLYKQPWNFHRWHDYRVASYGSLREMTVLLERLS